MENNAFHKRGALSLSVKKNAQLQKLFKNLFLKLAAHEKTQNES